MSSVARTLCGFILLSCVVANPALAGKIYKWVDEQGHVHFGEHAPTQGDTQEIQLKAGTPAPQADSSLPSQPVSRNIDDWCQRDQELCEMVRQVDPKCASSYCFEAAGIAGCDTAVCRAKRLDVVKKLQQGIRNQQRPPATGYRPLTPIDTQPQVEQEYVDLSEKIYGLLTPAQVKELVLMCEANRGVDCRSQKYLLTKARQARDRPWNPAF